MEQSITSLGISYFTERGLFLKKHTITAVLMTVALTVSDACVPYTQASDTSTLSIIRRIDTKGTGGLIHSRYIDEDGEKVSIETHSSKTSSRRRAAALPSSYDSREYGLVTPIRNQGVTGSCWSFAAIKALESDSIHQALVSLNTADFSESHLVWYAYDPLSDITDSLYGDCLTDSSDPDSYYKLGGNAYIASFILANWWGVVSESAAPFSAGSSQELKQMVSDMSQKPDTLRTQSDLHLKEVNFYDTGDIAGIKKAVMEHGSVDISLYFDSSNMYHDDTVTSAYENKRTADDANHCVTIIGWDDSFNQYSREAPGKGAWLIAGSYGENYKYSTNGYYWVSYYDTSLCEACTFEAEPADRYDTNFQYDGIGWGNMFYDSSDISFANIFTNDTDNACSIGAAGFYTYTDDQPYQIQVYRHITGTRPTSGTLISQCTTSGTAKHAGYHTVSLTTPAAIATGESFSLVMTYYAGNGNQVYVPIEGSNDSSTLATYHSSTGQSFLYTDGKWMDNTSCTIGHKTYNMNNVCLKALGNKISGTEYDAVDNWKNTEAPSSASPSATPAQTDSAAPVPSAVSSHDPAASHPPAISRIPAISRTPAVSPAPAASSSAAPSGSASTSPSSSSAPSDPSVSDTQTSAKSGTVTVKLKKKTIRIKKGRSKKLPIIVTPSGSYRKLTFQSKNKRIASVNKKGKVKAKKKGTTKITIRLPNGKKKTIKVIVMRAARKKAK